MGDDEGDEVTSIVPEVRRSPEAGVAFTSGLGGAVTVSREVASMPAAAVTFVAAGCGRGAKVQRRGGAPAVAAASTSVLGVEDVPANIVTRRRQQLSKQAKVPVPIDTDTAPVERFVNVHSAKVGVDLDKTVQDARGGACLGFGRAHLGLCLLGKSPQ